MVLYAVRVAVWMVLKNHIFQSRMRAGEWQGNKSEKAAGDVERLRPAQGFGSGVLK